MAFVFLRHDPYTLTLVGVAVVVVVARLAGRLFSLLHQPPVIGEVVAGILLGPTLLGDASTALFPEDGRPLLKMVATLGLVLFMFLVGIELDLSHLADRQRLVATVAIVGVSVPFLLGVALARVLYPHHDTGRYLPFALFMGAAMSITALPVLVRILRERGLHDKPLGVVATACAAGDDLICWCGLATVIAVISSSGGWDLPYIAALCALFGALMFKVVKPGLERFADLPLTETVLSTIVAGILASSFITSTIGVHEVFGAFILGVVFPRGALAEAVTARLGSITHFLLPVFFVTSGLHVDIAALGPEHIWQLALILLVACGGKVVGVSVGARVNGIPLRESLALGVLMNTRGLTELIVLNIGLDLGVLDVELFSLLVLMAVITTVATGPLMALVKPDPYLTRVPRSAANAEAQPPLGLILTEPRLGVTPDSPGRSPWWRRGPR